MKTGEGQVMHFYKSEQGTKFNYNPDMSGDLLITTKDSVEAAIPFDDIAEMFAECVIKPRMIGNVENMAWQKIWER